MSKRNSIKFLFESVSKKSLDWYSKNDYEAYLMSYLIDNNYEVGIEMEPRSFTVSDWEQSIEMISEALESEYVIVMFQGRIKASDKDISCAVFRDDGVSEYDIIPWLDDRMISQESYTIFGEKDFKVLVDKHKKTEYFRDDLSKILEKTEIEWAEKYIDYSDPMLNY